MIAVGQRRPEREKIQASIVVWTRPANAEREAGGSPNHFCASVLVSAACR